VLRLLHLSLDRARPCKREVCTIEAMLDHAAVCHAGLEALVGLVVGLLNHGLFPDRDVLYTGYALHVEVVVRLVVHLCLKGVRLGIDQRVHHGLTGSLLRGIIDVAVVAFKELSGSELRKDRTTFHRSG